MVGNKYAPLTDSTCALSMGIWYFMVNDNKRQMLFYGRGVHSFSEGLKYMMENHGWTLEDRIFFVDDDGIGDQFLGLRNDYDRFHKKTDGWYPDKM
jgi:hypothetical protein